MNISNELNCYVEIHEDGRRGWGRLYVRFVPSGLGAELNLDRIREPPGDTPASASANSYNFVDCLGKLLVQLPGGAQLRISHLATTFGEDAELVEIEEDIGISGGPEAQVPLFSFSSDDSWRTDRDQ